VSPRAQMMLEAPEQGKGRWAGAGVQGAEDQGCEHMWEVKVLRVLCEAAAP
jgi:hypothetical protein